MRVICFQRKLLCYQIAYFSSIKFKSLKDCAIFFLYSDTFVTAPFSVPFRSRCNFWGLISQNCSTEIISFIKTTSLIHPVLAKINFSFALPEHYQRLPLATSNLEENKCYYSNFAQLKYAHNFALTTSMAP